MNDAIREFVRFSKRRERELERQRAKRLRELEQAQKLARQAMRLELRGLGLPRAEQDMWLAKLDIRQRRQRRDLIEQIRAEQAPDGNVRVDWLPTEQINVQPAAPKRGRPKRAVPATLDQAIALRGELTRQLQVERNNAPSDFTFAAAVRSAAETHLLDDAAVGELITKVRAAGWRPSDAAARIAALKFGIALNRVRRDANPIPRRRGQRHLHQLKSA